MRYSFDIATVGDFADPRAVVRLARAAEDGGWDAVSIWDTLGVGMRTAAPDPFVALAGVAAVTSRIRLITSVLVVTRRRPYLVAQAAATLDRLSDGRLVLGIGAGGDPSELAAFAEEQDTARRMAIFDEAADLVDRYLRGERVSRTGRFAAQDASIEMRPIQEPRPPLWVGAMRPGGIRRAAAWDGWIAVSIGLDGVSLAVPPEAFAAGVDVARSARQSAGLADAPFDLAVFGQTGLGGFGPADYAAVGATWWLETVSPLRCSLEEAVNLAEAGPTRV